MAVAPDSGERLAALQQRDAAGLFEAALSGRVDYRLQVVWADGHGTLLDDPYRFGPVLGEMDAWLLGEGSHLRPSRSSAPLRGNTKAWPVAASRCGRPTPCASAWSVTSTTGTAGATPCGCAVNAACGRSSCPTWPRARATSSSCCRATASCCRRRWTHTRARPSCARRRPVWWRRCRLCSRCRRSAQRANALDAPMSIYEVHLGSWRRKVEHGNRWLDLGRLADELVPYAAWMGFTHLELMPVTEHRSTAPGATRRWVCMRPPRASVTRPALRVSSHARTTPGSAYCSTGCRRTSPAMSTAWRASTARRCTSTPTRGRASTTTGIR